MQTPVIDENLVKQLIISQFPQWAELPVKAVTHSGWDNRTFHLGDEFVVRLPSEASYAPQIKKEYLWLPFLGKHLTLKITQPIVLGEPTTDYPWPWSVNQWIEGHSMNQVPVDDLNQTANDLGLFLKELHAIESTGGPKAGPDNFYRGGALINYDHEMQAALPKIKDKKEQAIATQLWQQALSSTWNKKPVWVHGDLAVGNLLVKKGKLIAVIDFGQLAIGDPACDLVIAWNLFQDKSRAIFKKTVDLDQETWIRAMAWALWKTLCWPVKGTNQNSILQSIYQDFENIC